MVIDWWLSTGQKPNYYGEDNNDDDADKNYDSKD